MRGLRTAASVAVLLVFAGCGSSATTAPEAGAAPPSSGAPSVAPAHSEAPAANESTGPAVVGSQPGAVSVTVGTHGAGFADVICQDLGNGQLRHER